MSGANQKPPISQRDPAEGSREVIDRELARQKTDANQQNENRSNSGKTTEPGHLPPQRIEKEQPKKTGRSKSGTARTQ
ncbi:MULTISPECIES: hypothetical protein [unclassified Bradyrhizobium]|uniref:hypothetical protein n=1 Tax=unclassified Bradyrhizobium TaxID=2631580 RepID=UPI00247933BB|nr:MULTISPECIES: hypothetical protein [unclassified Bradyrhizobium]WGR71773.1 hypothetical protein MTX24_02030 [Bradyrhizobium sp. ISRA426]WGR76608.1 hypothetical protein MTX21_26980 [Bradyrhizobium sp. ISRA430]WGR87013.1 hypothetical protein MTX25_02030 [Bradyrhizobium sp. ISRA432]